MKKRKNFAGKGGDAVDRNQGTYLVFTVEGRRIGLSLSDVVRVSPAAELLEIPGGLRTVRGIVNVGGEAVPVADIRKKAGFPFPDMELGDRFVFFRNGERLLGILAEEVEGVLILAPETVSFHASFHGEECPVTGTVQVAFRPGDERGILLRTAENLLDFTEEDFLSLDPLLAGGEESR